jgi:hypothetical protein
VDDAVGDRCSDESEHGDERDIALNRERVGSAGSPFIPAAPPAAQ